MVDSGVCSPASCPSGCCTETGCVQATDQDWSACGTGGVTCTECAQYGVECRGGECTATLAMSAPFVIVVTTVVVQETDATGETWDLLGGLPDP